jgi:hypothetical protein
MLNARTHEQGSGVLAISWLHGSLEIKETNSVLERDGMTIPVGKEDGQDRSLSEDSIA